MRQSIPLHTGATMMRSPLCVAMLLAFGLAHPVSAQGTGGPKLRIIETNGIKMRIAEEGQGPLVLLLHGWPESWYSWRHQLPALAAAGFHAVAPDMRGFGKTDKPPAVGDYDIQHLTADIVGIIDARGEKTAVAEKDFDADPRGILSRLYLSPGSPREAPTVTDPRRAAGGWIPRLGAPKGLPNWLTQADLDYFVNEFTAAGFRGGINYYRNFTRNWETTPQLAGVKISQPVLFLAGEKDIVIRGASAEQLTALMNNAVTDLRGVKLFPGAGHWIQQERPEDTNAALLGFLKSLAKP